MKLAAVLLSLFLSACTGIGSKPLPFRKSTPQLTEKEVVWIANRYLKIRFLRHSKFTPSQWVISKPSYDQKTGEWLLIYDLKHNHAPGGSFGIYINDATLDFEYQGGA
jgi:hypothetical protein